MATTLDFQSECFICLRSTGHPKASYQVSSQLAFGSGEKSEKLIFKMAAIATILDFLSGGLLGFFELQVTLVLPTKIQVNWPFSLGEAKIGFQEGGHGRHLGSPIGMLLAIFDLQVTLMLPSKFQVNWPVGSGEEANYRISRWWSGLPSRPSWIFGWNHFSYF